MRYLTKASNSMYINQLGEQLFDGLYTVRVGHIHRKAT